MFGWVGGGVESEVKRMGLGRERGGAGVGVLYREENERKLGILL